MHRGFVPLWLAGQLLVASLSLTLAGCSFGPPPREVGPKIDCVPVKGLVRVNGQPAALARVTFVPTSSRADFNEFRTVTDEKGEFQCTTNVPNDGLPTGVYFVSVTWPEVLQEDWQTETDRLQGRYATPQTSGLRADILPPSTQLQPFDLR